MLAMLVAIFSLRPGSSPIAATCRTARAERRPGDHRRRHDLAMISRDIDLSPGSLIALSGVALALVFAATGNIFLGLLAGLGVALAVELFNALLSWGSASTR